MLDRIPQRLNVEEYYLCTSIGIHSHSKGMYACPVLFPYISRGDMSKLERVQSLCLRIISPNTKHYSDRTHICGVDYLSTVLEICCLKYVASIKQNPHHIFYQLILPASKDSHGRLLNNHSWTSLFSRSFLMRFCEAFILLLTWSDLSDMVIYRSK